MRGSWFLFAAAAIVAVSFDGVSATRGMDQEKRAAVMYPAAPEGRAKRFLRTIKTVADVVNDDKEERTVTFDIVKHLSLKSIDDLAADLAAIPGAAKLIKDDNAELFKIIAAKKWTPDTMAEKLDIASKRETMSKSDLKEDPGYLLWKHFSTFWDARKAHA